MSIESDTAQPEQGIIIIEEERLREGYTQIPNTILRRSDVTPGAKLTYIMLLSYAHQKDSCFPGQAKLADDIGVTSRSVITYLKQLQGLGLLAVKRRGLGKTNVYTLRRWADARSEYSSHQEVKIPTPLEVKNLHAEENKEEKKREQQHVVVVEALRNFGISRPSAEQLVRSYPEQYILEKLDFVQWLRDTQSSLITKSPAGYLRRALEDDYQPPPTYKPAAQRQAEQERRVRQFELDQQERREAEEQFLQTKERARKALAKEYPPQQIPGTELTTETAWQAILARLREQMTVANYQTWLSDTQMVSCDETTAVIVAPSRYVADWLRARFTPLLRKELLGVLGFPVQVDYLALTELGTSTEPPASPVMKRPRGRPRQSAPSPSG